MKPRLPLLLLALVTACGATEYRTKDPYRDGGTNTDGGTLGEPDAGAGGGGTGGGATGGGTTGGGATGGGATGGGATGGGATGGGATGGGTTGGGGGTCNATTCASGCCANGACVTATSNAQCGTGGAACQACGAPDSCMAGACAIDPASTWRMLPSELTVEDVWDATSPPDVELDLWCPASAGSVTAVMPKVGDSTNPTWSSGGCTLTAGQLINEGFDFAAYDIDLVDYQDITGRVHVPVTAAHLRAGVRMGSVGTITSITFTLTKQ